MGHSELAHHKGEMLKSMHKQCEITHDATDLFLLPDVFCFSMYGKSDPLER